jgi:NAD(P)-dependent dehydrogenase (short-subunit alcohol dehydrogenase family)
MARVFITGAADGLGHLSAKLLVDQGHQVVLHARNSERAQEAKKKVPGAEAALTGDLSDFNATKNLALEVNALGSFDAVIHNAGVYQVSHQQIFAVNTLAPYILTCLIRKPKRLIYLSSSMHLYGRPNLESFKKDGSASYSDSKLHALMLAKLVARQWPNVFSNAVDPGWVPTKMGGRGAPDNLQKGCETQAWLAVSDDPKAKVSGQYFYHQREKPCNSLANDISSQEKFQSLCEEITGIQFPE